MVGVVKDPPLWTSSCTEPPDIREPRDIRLETFSEPPPDTSAGIMRYGADGVPLGLYLAVGGELAPVLGLLIFVCRNGIASCATFRVGVALLSIGVALLLTTSSSTKAASPFP